MTPSDDVAPNAKPTPVSLLLRVRRVEDREAWDRLVELYTPLLFFWARRLDPTPADAADLVQEVFTILLQKLPSFEYEKSQSFRGWLWTVLVNKWREFKRRKPHVSMEIELPAEDNVDEMAEEQYRQYLVQRALELMREEFQPKTWQACWEHIVAGKSAAEVGLALDMSENAVYLASSRVLRRLREELHGLLS